MNVQRSISLLKWDSLKMKFISVDFEQVVGHQENHTCSASVHTCGEVRYTLYSMS